MPWTTPKTDWNSLQQEGVEGADFNRIENNAQHLMETKEPNIDTKNSAFNKDYAGSGQADTTARSDHSHQITDTTPIGAIQMYGGSTAPEGWLLCNIAHNLATVGTYAALFAVIGYSFGGAGVTFKTPNMATKIPFGAGGGLAGTVGDSIGNLSVVLEEGNIPSHHHSLSDRTYQNQSLSNHNANETGRDNATNSTQTTGNWGGSNGVTQGFDILQPSITLNYIIKYAHIYS